MLWYFVLASSNVCSRMPCICIMRDCVALSSLLLYRMFDYWGIKLNGNNVKPPCLYWLLYDIYIHLYHQAYRKRVDEIWFLKYKKHCFQKAVVPFLSLCLSLFELEHIEFCIRPLGFLHLHCMFKFNWTCSVILNVLWELYLKLCIICVV